MAQKTRSRFRTILLVHALEVRDIYRELTTKSIDAVSASMSLGSTAGNMPIRNWFLPSFRYGSVSTMPFARSAAATFVASMESSKLMVPTTLDRIAGSTTNGVVYEVFSAHLYRRDAESAL